MSVVAKFRVTELRQNHWNKTAKTIILEPVYDTSIPEDKRFCDATPSGRFEMLVNNQQAIAELELGKEFYITLKAVESV